jgi:hypothetical protein
MSDEQPARKRASPDGFYDATFPPGQRLPRRFGVRVEELDTEPSKVVLYKGRREIGNRLTDNSREDDGYRFHDIFHLAYATHLRWSPVVRKLLRRKRRSVSQIDEVEDGGRATVVEEGIAHRVFIHARSVSFFEGARSVDTHLIASILDEVSWLEVASASASQWEQAILDGFRVWREVRAHRGGIVSCDLNARRIRFKSIGTSVFTAHADAQAMGATHWSLPPADVENRLNLAVLLRREPRARCPYCSKHRVLWQPINQEGGPDSACAMCQTEAGWSKPEPLPCPYPTHVGQPGESLNARAYIKLLRGRTES